MRCHCSCSPRAPHPPPGRGMGSLRCCRGGAPRSRTLARASSVLVVCRVSLARSSAMRRSAMAAPSPRPLSEVRGLLPGHPPAAAPAAPPHTERPLTARCSSPPLRHLLKRHAQEPAPHTDLSPHVQGRASPGLQLRFDRTPLSHRGASAAFAAISLSGHLRWPETATGSWRDCHRTVDAIGGPQVRFDLLLER